MLEQAGRAFQATRDRQHYHGDAMVWKGVQLAPQLQRTDDQGGECASTKGPLRPRWHIAGEGHKPFCLQKMT